MRTIEYFTDRDLEAIESTKAKTGPGISNDETKTIDTAQTRSTAIAKQRTQFAKTR